MFDRLSTAPAERAENAERRRVAEMARRERPWRRWGPYLSERQWGTVREDYSADGDAWRYFPHDMARSRAYRWGEDGIAGLCDSQQRLCLALALWNGRDPILKERMFGLDNHEGNHGEDVKELYYYLDAVPSHAYLKMLYKYPQRAFPYAELVAENGRRGRTQPEFEIVDTGAFAEGRYFDVFVEYAKADTDDLLMLVTVHNRGPDAAPLHVLPQLWFRNTWSWGRGGERPRIAAAAAGQAVATHHRLGTWHFHAEGAPPLLFCENETNLRRLYGVAAEGYFKDAINDYVVGHAPAAVNPARQGTKMAAHYRVEVPASGTARVRVRLSAEARAEPFGDFDAVVAERRREADAYYSALQAGIAEPDARAVQRQALAGMIWSKQFYHFDVPEWLAGDPALPAPPPRHAAIRNGDWPHLNNADVLSMPDKWEYPWFAAWDLAFQCVALAPVDAEFAKTQLTLLLREWYMHPNGQLPAYEWNFGDANPPVHAWAAWRVFEIDRAQRGDGGDRAFLERVFHKLMLNFTWWVNRKDRDGRNVFQGGFLGLDNVGVFDRSKPLPTGGYVDQSDGTAWMAMYSLNLMRIALELALHNPVYEDVATKFFEHFLYIAEAMTRSGGGRVALWDEADEFFYDVLHLPDGTTQVLRVRSMVGLIPLFAVETLEPDLVGALPDFRRRLDWFLRHRPDLAQLVSRWSESGRGDLRLLSLLRGHRMKRLLRRMLDPQEFLADHGVRSLSRAHADHPYVFQHAGQSIAVDYQPGDAESALFGGNSNWRGPIWMPANFLIIEALRRFHGYYGDDFKVECPTGSGTLLTLSEIADEIAGRLVRLFLRGAEGRRPVFGTDGPQQCDPHFRDQLLFYEYFHGETGRGLGASHQTGWTGLVANLIADTARRGAAAPSPAEETAA